MKSLIRIAISLAIAMGAISSTIPVMAAGCASGTLIKGTTFPAVYYCGANGKRYVFPNQKTYNTWYSDFSNVITLSDADLGNISIGGNVTYKPGVRMVKVTTMPNAYAVAAGGTLRWVKSEALASAYYGANWNQMIDDVPDAFFTNYTIGADIDDVSDYSPSGETSAAISINVDKGLAEAVVPKTVEVSITRTGYVQPSATVNVGDTVRWTNTDTVNHSVTSNPHPSHTDFPSLNSGTISSGLTWSLTFNQAGTFGYHDHVASPGTQGTIIVVQP